MRKIVCWSLLLTTAFLLGCSKGGLESIFGKSEGELKGEVFIVTKSAVNFKLGLVEVTAIPESEVNIYLERIREQVDTEIKRLKREIDAAEKRYNQANELYVTKQRVFEEVQKLLISKCGYTFAGPYPTRYDSQGLVDQVATVAARRECDVLNSEFSKAENEYHTALSDAAETGKVDTEKKEKLKALPTSEFYFERLPKGVVHAVTNADGKFTMTLPSTGRFALAAHSQREIFGSTEEYYWLIWASLDGEKSKSVMLTNKNLMTSQSPDSVAQAKASSPPKTAGIAP